MSIRILGSDCKSFSRTKKKVCLFFGLYHEACGILVSWLGLNPDLPQWKPGVHASGKPGNFQEDSSFLYGFTLDMSQWLCFCFCFLMLHFFRHHVEYRPSHVPRVLSLYWAQHMCMPNSTSLLCLCSCWGTLRVAVVPGGSWRHLKTSPGEIKKRDQAWI